jgi:hypothetical protein
MTFRTNRKIITLLIVFALTITVLSSCNRAEEEQDTTSAEIKTSSEPITQELEKVIEEVVEPEVFDDSELGYSVVDDKLFLNDKELPTKEIANTVKEEDRVTYEFYDGAALIIKSNGDLIVNFPVRITLLIDKDFTTFQTLYRGHPLTNANIFDFITADNWYTIDYGEGTTLKFNNTELIFSTENLIIDQKKDSCETIFKNFVISNSNILDTDALTSIIKIQYEDGNQLTHIIGGSTTFIFNSGTSIESDGETTTIKKDDQTTVVKGEITGIDFNEETGEIQLETTEESVKLDTTGSVLEQKVLTVEPEVEQDNLLSEEEVLESENLEQEEIPPALEDGEPAPEFGEGPQDSELPPQGELGPNNGGSGDGFDQEISGDWDDEEIVSPYRIGIIPNFTFLQYGDKNSEYGLRGDFVVENEVVEGTVIGLQIGLGADHFDADGTDPQGFYKELVTYATFSQEFTPNYSNVSYFYKVGLGSLIPLDEGDTETPYFRLGLSLGINFHIDQHWMLRFGGEAAINYRTDIETSESAYIGLFYKFK